MTDPESAPQVGRELEQRLGYPYRTLDWQTQNVEPVQRAGARKAGDGADYLFHHGGSGVQHRRDADHGGDRQDPRDRDPAGHGPHGTFGGAHFSGTGRRHRPGRHRCWGCSADWRSRTWWTAPAGSGSIPPSISSIICRSTSSWLDVVGRGPRQPGHRDSGDAVSVPLGCARSRRSRRSGTNEGGGVPILEASGASEGLSRR